MTLEIVSKFIEVVFVRLTIRSYFFQVLQLKFVIDRNHIYGILSSLRQVFLQRNSKF